VAFEETVCSEGEVRTRWWTRKRDAFGPSYYVVYKTVCYFVFRSVGPLLVLLVLNARLVVTLHRRGRRRCRMDRSSAAGVVVDEAPPVSAAAAVSALSAVGTTPAARRRNLQRENITLMKNITLMLVVVVFVFIVCQLPDMALRITAVRCLLAICSSSITSPRGEVRSTAMSVSVCLSVCPLAWLKSHMSKLSASVSLDFKAL